METVDTLTAESLMIDEEMPKELTPEYQEYFDFEKSKIKINHIIDSWSEEIQFSKQRRKERYVDLDIETLRSNGDIEEDETFLPVRIIDTNIMREKPELLSFLKGGDRLAIFRPLSNPFADTQRLEEDFTQGLTYKGWYKEFDRLIDGASLHGDDAIEVIFDQTKPLHVGFEHVGHDRLYYNREVFNIQDSDYIIRRYDLSIMRIKSFVDKFGFDAEQVSLLTEKSEQSSQNVTKTLCIFKVYYKFENCVYVAWYSRDGQTTDWLKQPEKLFLGIQELTTIPGTIEEIIDPVTGVSLGAQQMPDTQEWVDKEIDEYPYVLHTYREDENEKLTDKKGRGFLDAPIQEAATAINTALVNSTMRASNLYGSPKTEDGENAEMKMLDIKLTHGLITSRPMEFYNTPFPDPAMFSVLQSLASQNAQETGKTSFAVMNRKDSRKTAEELKQANAAQGLMSSTVIASFSETLRTIFTYAWKIIKSQASQDKIPFLLTKQIDPQTGMETFVNDQEAIKEVYDIRAAGDIDVIQRDQLLMSMKQDWPVIQGIPGLSQIFLQDMIRLSYPKKAKEYVLAMQQGDVATNIINSLMAIAQGAIQPAEWQGLSPQQQTEMQNVFAMAQQYVAAKSGQQVGQNQQA